LPLTSYPFLRDQTGNRPPFAPFPEYSLPVEKNMKSPEEMEEFVGLENVMGLTGTSGANFFLLRRIGFENDYSSLFQASFYPGNQATVEEIKIENEVISPREKAISIQIRGNRLDPGSPCL